MCSVLVGSGNQSQCMEAIRIASACIKPQIQDLTAIKQCQFFQQRVDNMLKICLSEIKGA